MCTTSALETLFREMKADLSKWKDVPCLWVEDKVFKMEQFSSWSSALQLQCRSWEADPKTHMETSRNQSSQENLEKEEHRRFTLLNFKTYYKVTEVAHIKSVIQT